MKNSLKNFYNYTKVFFIPLLSILTLVFFLYTFRLNSYWNFLRNAPFYAGIYFWQNQRPDAFTFFSVFILGIFTDVLEGYNLGINIITYVLFFILTVYISERFNITQFSYSWALFALSFLLAIIFKAVLISLLSRQLIYFSLLIPEYFLTIAIYPLFSRFYIFTEKKFIHIERPYEKD